MSSDLVEVRLNSGLVISLYAEGGGGWFDNKNQMTERQLWQRMAHLIQNTDWDAVKKLYGKMPPEPVLLLKKPEERNEGP